MEPEATSPIESKIPVVMFYGIKGKFYRFMNWAEIAKRISEKEMD